MNWLSKVKDIYHIKPLEHFKKNMWSIQTERTHGVPGLVKVSRAQLENPAFAMPGRESAGGEDIYYGDKANVINYVKNTYRCEKIVFV